MKGRFLAAMCAAMLLACNGGTEVPGVGSGGTGATPDVAAVTVGPIAGLGSIIIQGIRYDESGAALGRDDGRPIARADLRLGMIVEVRGTANATAATGIASAVTVSSLARGVVASATADGFRLNGVTVARDANTIVDSPDGLADGDLVEVYGYRDGVTGAVLATRVEEKAIPDYKSTGTVSGWEPAARRFRLGTTGIAYGAATLPPGFGEGSAVRVASAVAPPAEGSATAWSVASVDGVVLPAFGDGGRAELHGTVEVFGGVASLRIAGVAVDAGRASFVDGSAEQLRQGVCIEVVGVHVDGVLVATQVRFKPGSGGSAPRGGGEGEVRELHGTIGSFRSVASFRVRETLVDAGGEAVAFVGGTASALADGVCVGVAGRPESSGGVTRIVATRVTFEARCRQ